MKRFNLCLVLILASCQGDPSLSLDEGQASDDWSELRRRMNVIVVDSATDAQIELTPTQFAQFNFMVGNATHPMLGHECANQVEDTMPTSCPGYDPNPDDPTSEIAAKTCAMAACDVQYRLCVAHRLMEFADAPSSDRMVGTLEVPPLDQSTQAGFHSVAIDAAREAVIGAARSLNSLCGTSNEGDFVDVTIPVDERVTLPESLAHAITEGYYLVHDAAMEAFDENLAIADESYSVEPSLTRAARRAYGAPVLSRGAIAHELLGYPPDLVADTTNPAEFEPAGALPISGGTPSSDCVGVSDSVQNAIDAIRESAMNPVDIKEDTVSIDQLIAGDGPSATVDGSLRERLEVTVDAEIPSDPDEFYASIGIERSDFVSARRFIVAELDANHRDASQELPARELTGGRPDEYSDSRYAAVATPPGRRPSLQWAAMALASPRVVAPEQHGAELTLDTATAVSADYARRSVAATMDFAISSAVALTNSAVLGNDTKNGLASLVAAAETERPARIESRKSVPSTR